MNLKNIGFMDYKVIEIEGVGPAYAAKLKAAGFESASDLLGAGLTEAGRIIISQNTGIPEPLINRWVNHADLFRVDGIGPQFAEILCASGINSVEDLAKCDATELEARLRATDEKMHLTRRVPSVKELEKMINLAAQVEPVLSY